MSDPYDELLAGEITLRLPPGARHELILGRLQTALQLALGANAVVRLLPSRGQIKINAANSLRPDLAVVTAANNKLWLAIEIISSDDHQADTVVKKQIYEELKVPRLWMVDPRYDNVEVYHTTEYGLKLVGILAGRDVLEEKLFPFFRLSLTDLFAPENTN